MARSEQTALLASGRERRSVVGRRRLASPTARRWLAREGGSRREAKPSRPVRKIKTVIKLAVFYIDKKYKI